MPIFSLFFVFSLFPPLPSSFFSLYAYDKKAKSVSQSVNRSCNYTGKAPYNSILPSNVSLTQISSAPPPFLPVLPVPLSHPPFPKPHRQNILNSFPLTPTPLFQNPTGKIFSTPSSCAPQPPIRNHLHPPSYRITEHLFTQNAKCKMQNSKSFKIQNPKFKIQSSESFKI